MSESNNKATAVKPRAVAKKNLPRKAGETAVANVGITAKLLKIQRALEPMKKDSKNPYHKNLYFDINSLLSVIRPLLNAEGILLYQPTQMHNDQVMSLETRLVDVETETAVTSNYGIKIDDNPQKTAAAITYARRYSLQTMLGLEAEDDDGNTASGVTTKKRAAPKKAAAPTPDNTPEASAPTSVRPVNRNRF